MSGVSDRGSCWQIWWWVDGRRQWTTLDKDKYSRREAKREAGRREGEGKSAIPKIRTFRQLADNFFTHRKVSESTRYKIGKFVDVFEEFLKTQIHTTDVEALTERVIREYIETRLKNYKPSSVNFDISYLKWLFKKGAIAGILKHYPLEDIHYLPEERQVKVLPTKEEVEKILHWFRKNEPIFFPWIYFEMTRGWRRDELRLMKVEDIDLQGERLYVKHTKTGVQRIERLTEQDCRLLNEHIIFLKKIRLYQPSGFLFPSKKGELICKNTLLTRIKRACRKLEITKNITNHLFRHYVVTSILDTTANIEVVKAITGHKDTKTILEHYAHACPENVRKGLEITRIDVGLKAKSV